MIFAASYLTQRYGGTIDFIDNIIYIKNGKDEFYCDTSNKTETDKWRFWHKSLNTDSYHRQLDRKNIVVGLYTCLTHINKYAGIPYCRKERIAIHQEIIEAWRNKKKEIR